MDEATFQRHQANAASFQAAAAALPAKWAAEDALIHAARAAESGAVLQGHADFLAAVHSDTSSGPSYAQRVQAIQQTRARQAAQLAEQEAHAAALAKARADTEAAATELASATAAASSDPSAA